MALDLFTIEDNQLIVSPHALMIQPFKTMWEVDDTENKHECRRMFMYIELLCSPKKSNPFHGYSEKERPAKVKQEIFGGLDYESNVYSASDIIEAIAEYRKLLRETAPGYDLYITGTNAADKLREFLEGFNPDERTKAGGLVLKPSDIAKAIQVIPDVVKGLILARETVHSEVNDFKTKGQREIGIYEE